ncbi:hypothetical protein JW905_15830 [bacterium]|nr:hypothetical protein [candidate division CSSED10-310 bacterium]
MANVVTRVNQEFDRLVHEMSPSQLQDEFMAMNERLLSRRALAGPKVLPTFIKPFFLSESQLRYFRETVETVLNCQEKLIDLYFTVEDFRPFFELTEPEVPLVNIPGRLARRIYFSRMDTIMYGAGIEDFMFLEFNCDSPGGAHYADIQVEELMELSLMKQLQRDFFFMNEPYRPKVLNALLTAWWQAGGRRNPHIAVMGNPKVTNVEEFRLFAEYFAERGLHGFFTDPWSLEYDGRRLAKDGRPIDLIYRRGVLSDYSQHVEEVKPVISAYEDGNVVFANPLSAKLGDNKNLLSLLTDERLSFLFTAAEQEALLKHIPWTRIMREGLTTYKGEDVDLFPFVREHREQLVIKPNSMFGGKGVVIGHEATQQEWDDAIGESCHAQKVVQQYVPIPRMEFPVITPDGVTFEEKKINHNFFTFAGYFGGGFCRTSDSSIINISAGGALVTFFVVKD